MSLSSGTIFKLVSAVTDSAKIDVSDASATAHTITSGKSLLYFVNSGSTIVWWGGSTIDPDNSRGAPLLPLQGFVFENVAPGFKVYFKCTTGLSGTISIIEG